jgi:uracil phosphoribosyltransferase
MPVTVATHPLIAHKLTHLRNEKTTANDFRRLLKEITFYLGFNATENIKLATDTVRTPMGVDFEGAKIGEDIAIIPVLRAGLGMAEGMLELLPNSAVYHIGNEISYYIMRQQ